LAVETDHPGVHVVPRERMLTGHRLGMGRTELVVREDEVRTTALHVEADTEVFKRDGTALDVPSRASAAEAAVPRGFPGAFDTPQEGVERIPFAWSIRVSPTLREDRAHRLVVIVRLVAESAGEGAVEIHVGVLGIVDPIGGAAGEQLLDHLDDLGD